MMKRRTFLTTAMTGMAAASFGRTGLIGQDRQKPLGVALVGLGYYSTDLLAPALALTQRCRLAGIVTGSPSKAKAWQELHKLDDKNIYSYDNFDAIANNDNIDVVYIVLPPSMHAAYTVRAANAGKHVWCEKPMAMTVSECEQMISACKKNKVALSIGYRMQHEPNTQQIISFGKNKTYGAILEVTAEAGYFDGRSDHWKQNRKMGGGATYDMGVYTINGARYSTNLEPIAVSAKQSTNRPNIYHSADETMEFTLEFPNGITARCKTSLGDNLNVLEVKARNGSYRLSPFQSYSGIRGTTSDGRPLNAAIPNQQARQMDDDALSIIQQAPMLVPGEEGLKDIRVVEAIFRSVKENRRVTI